MNVFAWALPLALMLLGCASQPQGISADTPGFFTGVLHGVIALPALVAGLFSDVRVYAFPNEGYWYDVGFCLGALLALEGGNAAFDK